MTGWAMPLLIVCLAALAWPARADVRVARCIGDHMVLQHDAEVTLWGRADPGEAVKVVTSWRVQTQTVANGDGAWRVKVRTPRADPGAATAQQITISGARSTITIGDVLLGQVWIVAGGMNVAMPMGDAGGPYRGIRSAAQEIAACEVPTVRVLQLETAARASEQFDVRGDWVTLTSDRAPRLSALGVTFARAMAAQAKMPAGVIVAASGNTRIEAWSPPELLERAGGCEGDLVFCDEVARDPKGEARTPADERSAWWDAVTHTNGGQVPREALAEFDDRAWHELQVPNKWRVAFGADWIGSAWLRKRVEIPAEWVGREIALDLGLVDEVERVYVNGVEIGTGGQYGAALASARSHRIPAAAVTSREVTIAICAVSSFRDGGFMGESTNYQLRRGDRVVPLAGAWRIAPSEKIDNLPKFPSFRPFDRRVASSVWNGMIAPLTPMTVSGVVWWQAEADWSRHERCAALYPAFIGAWRQLFGRELTWVQVTLPAFAYAGDAGQAAALRVAQAGVLGLPGVRACELSDLCESSEIVSWDKVAQGERIAKLALDGAQRGPRLKFVTLEDGKLRIKLDQSAGLSVRGAAIEHLEIAGIDGLWHTAQARIDGSDIIAWSEGVAIPVHARLAWGAADAITVFNASGLPAERFSTVP